MTQASALGACVVHVAAIPLEQEQRCIRCQSVLTTDKHPAFPSPAGKFVTTVMEDGIPHIRTERNYDADVSAGEERCASREEEWSEFEELLRNWPPMFHSGCPDAKAARGAPAGYVMVFRQQSSPTDAYIQCTQCLMRLGTVDIEFLLSMVRPGK